MAIERPTYTVELSEKPFEVRDYAPTIVAVVHADGDRSGAVNAGFRMLAGYIFGNNQSKGKIAMTAPVKQQALQAGWDIRFTMPSEYTLDTLPKPTDSHINVVRVGGQRMASVTFSGFWSDANFQAHQESLMGFLKNRRLTAISAPIYAYYDAPWTPWFLRTNEVLVEISTSRL